MSAVKNQIIERQQADLARVEKYFKTHRCKERDCECLLLRAKYGYSQEELV